MRLILKHLWRSIRKKPLQPIILILVLTLSVTTAIFAFTLDDMIEDDIEAAQAVKYGNASCMISVGNSSDSRFLFVDDVIDVLGESVDAVGCYDLPLILEGTGDTAIAMAAELDRIPDVFDIKFSEYGRVTESSVGNVAFISADFAKERELSVGDTLAVETMGYAKNYRIEGISAHPFLASYDVIVDISGVVKAFADQSLLFAAIGEDFKPCGRIYVHIEQGDNMTAADAIARLKSDARFSEKTFEELLNAGKNQINREAFDMVVKISVALAALLSAVVSFCCLYIMANERAQENLTLAYCGAGPCILSGMQYAEVIFYWLISVPLGFLAAIPVTKLLAAFVDLRYARVSIYASTVLKSALIILTVCLLTCEFFILFNKRIKRRGKVQTAKRRWWIAGLSVLLAVLFVLLYLSPAALRLNLYIAVMAVLITLTFAITPLALKWIAGGIDKKIGHINKTPAVTFRYALKNICSLKLLHNIARLCALMVTIILTIGMMFAYTKGCIKSWQQVFDADYLVLNATDRCYEKTKSCERASSVYRAYMSQSELGAVVSADDPAAYGDGISAERQPKGNQAILSIGVAHKLDVGVGESFLLELNGISYELTVLDIEEACINYITVSCEDMGIPYNMLLVEGKDGTSSAELLADLSETTSTELASIISGDALTEQKIRYMESYVNAGKILLIVFLTFSMIGMVNISYESLRARKEEFGLYRIGGMSRKNLRFMQASELVVSVLVGILVGIAAFIISAFAAHRGMSGLGGEIFIGIRQLLH